MNAERLKPLLLDRAVGQLSPDVAELLDAYLSHDPRAAAELADLRQTVDTAAVALRSAGGAEAAALPPFPRQRVAAALSPSAAGRWARPLALAASIALAFALGTRWPAGSSVSPSGASAVFVAADKPSERGFWGVSPERVAGRGESDKSVPAVRWFSPLKWPRFAWPAKEGAS